MQSLPLTLIVRYLPEIDPEDVTLIIRWLLGKATEHSWGK